MTNEDIIDMSVEEYNGTKGDLMYYDCPICFNRGDIAYRNGDTMRLKKCGCLKLRRTRYNLDKQGKLFEFDTCRFDNFDITEQYQRFMLERCQEFIKDNKKCIMLLGQTGCGKTHLCNAMIRVYAKKYHEITYMSWVEDSRTLKRLATDQVEYQNAITKYKIAEVLYIDDLFKGEITEADKKLAFEIIDYRYKCSKTETRQCLTIISSERLFNEITAIDEAVAGRLAEMSGKAYIIQIGKDKDKNYRLKGV